MISLKNLWTDNGETFRKAKRLMEDDITETELRDKIISLRDELERWHESSMSYFTKEELTELVQTINRSFYR
ncbi:MAG: hypothetical protein OEY10_00250 [Nitrosopumilus sp.]|nr:hypothetical protein [Nitrosopumilus sp.]